MPAFLYSSAAQSSAGLGHHLVAAGEHRRLGPHLRRMDPCGLAAGPLAPASAPDHHRAGPVRGRAGLEVADRIPEHRRVLDHLEADVGSSRWANGFLSAFWRSLSATRMPVSSGAPRATDIAADQRREIAARPRHHGLREGHLTDSAHMASHSLCFS